MESTSNTANSSPDILAKESKQRPHPARHVLNATWYSIQGFASAWKHEQAFRLEMYIALVLVPVALLLPVSWLGKALMIGSVILVLMVELLNSAIEWCVDLACGDQRHTYAKRAKDMASAAVFLSLVNCLTMWVLVLVSAYAGNALPAP